MGVGVLCEIVTEDLKSLMYMKSMVTNLIQEILSTDLPTIHVVTSNFRTLEIGSSVFVRHILRGDNRIFLKYFGI